MFVFIGRVLWIGQLSSLLQHVDHCIMIKKCMTISIIEILWHIIMDITYQCSFQDMLGTALVPIKHIPACIKMMVINILITTNNKWSRAI